MNHSGYRPFDSTQPRAGHAARCTLLYYATHDGQSRRIAERVAGHLLQAGIAVPAYDLASGSPGPAELHAAGLVVVVAAVRYGRHLPQAERFFATCRTARTRLVLISVNLTARKPGKDTVSGNRYLQKAIARYRLRPVLAAAVAGRLEYRRYSWRDRLVIRLIMWLTGGPTDPRACVEFTDWLAVDEIAAKVAELASGRPSDEPHFGDTRSLGSVGRG